MTWHEEQVSFTWRYKVFEVGERVRPTSPRCPLDPGVYTVSKYVRPLFYDDTPVVFVEGRDTGLTVEYLESADAEKDK